MSTKCDEMLCMIINRIWKLLDASKSFSSGASDYSYIDDQAEHEPQIMV
jgi:hypothetical protein